MKYLIFSFGLCLFFTSSLLAQNQEDRFTTTMGSVLASMEPQENTPVDWEAITNKLERIAAAEPDQWLPSYYLSYATLQRAMVEMSKGNTEGVERYVKASASYLEQAKTKTAMNSELKCQEGYVMQGYIWIDQVNNGPQYAGAAHAAYAAAAQMDPENPRPLMLRGMLVLFTPEFFGGGAEKAMPLLQGADQLYQLERSKERGLLPTWGYPTNQWMLNKAQSQLATKE
ncbi:hypothetical protein [Lewinella sp. LCG006]|uniref:hypothetical protein n=1 Tax=Lewinella sp. LCG006 TaxID=3231911 RepID=UPI0034613822